MEHLLTRIVKLTQTHQDISIKSVPQFKLIYTFYALCRCINLDRHICYSFDRFHFLDGSITIA